jgi:hypothetical protein
LYSKGFQFWSKQLTDRSFAVLFVSFPEQNQEIMKKLTLSLVILFFALLVSCTDDETIEEQVYKQEIPSPEIWASGEEGYDGTDNVKDQ